jgi:hypothetical protein
LTQSGHPDTLNHFALLGKPTASAFRDLRSGNAANAVQSLILIKVLSRH